MSEIDEMLTRIERAVDYYEKHTDDIGLPIFMRDIANTIILLKASEEAAGSLLLDLQQDCIKERQRAEAAEKRIADLVAAYDHNNPLRTADVHRLDCTCMRCAIDKARQ